MKESLIEKIMRQTGCTLSEDGCEKFRAGCSSPCLGTPQDMLRLIEAGYGPNLEKFDWDEGLSSGAIDFAVPIVRIAPTKDGCPFRNKKRCMLEADDLKPTGGRLTAPMPQSAPCPFERSPDWNIVREWVLSENALDVSHVLAGSRSSSEKHRAYRAPSQILVFNASRMMIAMANSLQTAAWLTGANNRAITLACQGRYVSTAGLYFRRRHPRVVIDDSDWESLKLEKYDALCGEHRRYYSREKMKSLRGEFERKRESGIESEENDSG